MGTDGSELFTFPIRAGLSGISYHGLRRHLRSAGAEYQRGQRCEHGALDVHRIYGAIVLHAVQEQQRRKIDLQCLSLIHI